MVTLDALNTVICDSSTYNRCCHSALFLFILTELCLYVQVQIRPWNLNDSDFVMDGSQPLDPRKTIFVGGVPRPLRAGVCAFAKCIALIGQKI